MTAAPRWRLGGKVPHHVYRQRGDEPDRRSWPDGDPPIGMFLDPTDARLAVLSVNNAPGPPREVVAAARRLRDAIETCCCGAGETEDLVAAMRLLLDWFGAEGAV